MSLTKIVSTFAFVVTLTVAFSSSPMEVQAQSGSRSVGDVVGDVVGGVAGSSTRSAPSVVTDFGGTQETFGSYVAPTVGAPVEQFSGAPISSGPVYSSAPVSSDCGCGAPAPAPAPVVYSAPAPAPAPSCGCSAPALQPIASPCGGGGLGGGGCGSGCRGGGGCGCGGGNFGTLRRGPATGRSGLGGGGLFQRGRPCGCN